MRNVFGILSVVISITASAAARDFYVDNVAGNDLFTGIAPNSGGSESGPCRSIGRALRLAHKGDRIIITNTGQPYHECITLQAGRHSGLSTLPFEIVGNGATLEGAIAVPQAAWHQVTGDVYKFSPRLKSYQLLFKDNRPAERVSAANGSIDLPTLKPLQWCLFEREVYFCAEKDRTPAQYKLSFCRHTVGITLYEVRHVRISNLVVQGFQLDGINAHDNARDITLSGVTCRGNARSGVSVGGASQVRIEDSLLGNNGAAQLRSEGYSHTHVIDSDLLDNTAPAVVRKGGDVRVESTRPTEDQATQNANLRPIQVVRNQAGNTAY